MKNAVQDLLEELEKPEKLPKPRVAYERHEDGYYLYTIDQRATKILAKHGVKFRYQQRPNQYFVAFIDKLVRRPGISYYEHKIEAPTEVARVRIEKLNQKRLRMARVMDRMAGECSLVEDELVAELQKHGLKLKPGAPLDAQLLDRKEHDGQHYRLHFRQSLKKSYDQEAVEELSRKYPALKAALKTRETLYLDKVELEAALPELPPNVAALIVSLIPISSFNEEPLSAPECHFCGGKLLRNLTCRHCGLSSGQEKS